MTANYMSGFCNLDHCSHPCCWNYYRKLIKHQVSPSDVEERKLRPIEAAHQSIYNINADSFLKERGNKSQLDVYRHRESKNNALLDYLISRKKLSSSSGSQSIPNQTHLRDATNVSGIQNKISTVDVHEIFDLDELQSDWRKTFQAKDYYIWIPANKDFKTVKDDSKPMRSVKTPILQLAPVTDSRINSGLYPSIRKDLSFTASGSDILNQRTISLRARTMPRSMTKIEPLNDHLSSTRNTRDSKEYIRHKSLEAAFNQAKMQIHNSYDKTFTRYDFGNPAQIYLMDENFSHDIHDICSSSRSRQPPASPNDSDSAYSRSANIAKPPKSNQVQFKGVSIIQSVSCDNSFDLKLEPKQKRMTPIKSAISQRKEAVDYSSDDRSSVCDSMVTNAISNRSTLHDDDILPGSSMLHMLQNSYKLIQERSENLADRNKDSSRNIDEHIQDKEVQLHKVNVSYSRTAKSAPDKKILKVDIPNPPPPTPDLTDRIRSTSAAAKIHFNE